MKHGFVTVSAALLLFCGAAHADQETGRLERACSANDAAACMSLGTIFENGRGKIKQDGPRAVRYYSKACEFGNGSACGRLGLIYENGTGGIEKSTIQAAKYFQKGCHVRDRISCAALGRY